MKNLEFYAKPGDFYTKRAFLCETGISIQNPDIFIRNAQTLDFIWKTRPSILLYKTRNIFKIMFRAHLGPLRAIGARFFLTESMYWTHIGLISEKKKFFTKQSLSQLIKSCHPPNFISECAPPSNKINLVHFILFWLMMH